MLDALFSSAVHPRAIDSESSQHKRAASDHELAAREHRKAASLYDQARWHAASLAAASAMECAEKAHKQSISAFERSQLPPRKG
jgi:hypothetical protein